ncbi:hypothetical protein LAZ67_1006840 [Cordylochernes scorpioides]|uniref:Integrase catalytic domain-containing protein n=1 Tax=Cordylochernes scorpioides TaxID=51811 RepID=A0ABY6K0M7_9ARAC|nr:hypothetical protein LAZ67_1006840 [Cordylochernes scorpioides]
MGHPNSDCSFYLRQLRKKIGTSVKMEVSPALQPYMQGHQFIPPSLRIKDPVRNPFLRKDNKEKFTEVIMSITRDIQHKEKILTGRQQTKLSYWVKKYQFPQSAAFPNNSSNGIVNLSSIPLSEKEERVLALGLHYVPPDKPDIPRLIAGVEGALKNLNHMETLRIRHAVTQVLRRPYHPVSYARDHRSLIQKLRKTSSLVITKADKGNQTVLMDRADYEGKMMNILADTSTFTIISTSAKDALVKGYKSSLRNLMKAKQITKAQLTQFTGSLTRDAYIYGAPKIHKPGVPLRPIIAYHLSPAHTLAKYLAQLLSPIMKNNPNQYNITHPPSFVQEITQMQLPAHHTMVSFDVTALYLSLPHALILNKLQSFLKSAGIQDQTITLITQLTSLCLSISTFTFNHQHYKQIRGTPMGSPLSSIVAEGRDGVLGPVDQSDAFFRHPLLEEVCGRHLLYIKFTYETETNLVLPFLDILIIRTPHRLHTAVYYKKNNPPLYTHFSSNSPVAYKVNTVRTLTKRIHTHCSLPIFKAIEKNRITTLLTTAGYPRKFIDRHTFDPTAPRTSTTYRAVCYLPYSSFSVAISRILRPYGIQVYFNSPPNLAALLRNPITKADAPNNPIHSTGAVYAVSCQDCPASYVGETGRTALCLKWLQRRISTRRLRVFEIVSFRLLRDLKISRPEASIRRIATRRITRTRFTKVVNVLDSEISKTNADLGVIRDKFSKLKDIDFKSKDLDQKMLDHMMVADAEEDTLNCEIEEAEHYSDTFIALERKVRELIDSDNKSDVKSLGSSNGSLMAKSYKLPKIEIRKFDGELINWLPFWAHFEKIHEDTELLDADKFHYLVQSMQSNTRARELIESYPQTADNYAKAVQALKQRYGQKDLLVEIYVRELLKLMMANVKTPPDERRSVAKLYDKLETQLRSLESLGVDTKENTAWLFPMIESCLPEDVLVAWQRSPLNNCDASKNSNSNSSSRLNNLLDFLRREVEGEERGLLARRGFEGSSPKEKLRNKFKQNSNIPTTAGLFSAKEMGCLFCENNHQRHYVLLCSDLPCNRKEKTHVSEVVQSALANQQCTRDITLMTLMVNIMGNNGYRRVRALLDPGSQKSYILESTALEVKLKPIGNVNIAHSLFGGTQTETKCHKVYKVAVWSNLSELDTEREFDFLGQDIICGEIPRMPKGAWLNELKGSRIWLSDLGRDSPKIELLIGSDIYGSLLSGCVKQLENGLTAIETHLGWTICGPSPKKDEQTDYSSLVVISMHSRNMSVDYLWDLETIGIKDPRENLTKLEEDKIVHQHFLNTVHQLKNGRFCVGLPWLGNQEGIPSNRHIAERRLFNTTRKLRAKGIFSEYDRVFQEWLAEGVIEKVSLEDLNRNCHYLPHHPVVKANSNTTKIRPVFDASCKDKGNLSLNDCLASGPNVIEQIPAILLKFREKAIGVIADIRKAFLQIEVKEEDRDYLRFLWWKSNHQIQVFRHKRVVFGVTCSPYLLGAVILHHLKGVSSEFGALPQKLMECLYIDNCVTSVDTEAELVDLVEKSTEIFAKAKMDLRMWQFGPIHRVKEVYSRLPPSVDIERSEEASVLSMKWDLLEDTLNVTPKFGVIINSLSKRDLLSHTQQIFDPIGFLAPVLLPAKLLIQQAWTWYSELDTLADIKIPRRVGHGIRAHWSIHIFCDASQSAYAAAAFLRCPENKGVSVQLLMAKSRLGPLKKTTIPRMELLACMLGVRLSRYITESLNLAAEPVYYWTDSTTALSWIKTNRQWGTFVNNRVKEICNTSGPNKWFYVPGSLNPADLPSRGCSVLQLKRTRWWEGPEWLKQPQDHWPKQLFHSDRTLINLEIDRQVLVTTHIVRINAWIRRFIRNTQKLSPSGMHSLQLSELEDSEKGIWKTVQQQVFSSRGDSINGLMIIRDDFGLIRIKSKLIERDDEYSFRYAILLPTKHHVVTCLIREFHLRHCHAGVQILSAKLRENYWILNSRRSIRSVVSQCAKCRRFSSKPVKTTPIHLPLDRVRDATAFEILGVDLAGPLYLKNKTKAWIVLFTCAVFRAIHLELVTSLSTEAFIQALRRFIARRGRPTVIYSDNGTNFVGTNNALKALNWNKIVLDQNLHKISWKFIPPTAAWWGGWWERLIRSIKDLLVRILGDSSVYYEEMSTILCDAEATINSRPLTYIHEDFDSLIPLSPSMFLHDSKYVGVPDLDKLDSKKFQDRYRHCQRLREALRSRFRSEYLGQLVQKANERTPKLSVGDVVIVKVEDKRRLHWPMARIVELFPGRDGHSRVAKVRTKLGTLYALCRSSIPWKFQVGIQFFDPKEILQLKKRIVRLSELDVDAWSSHHRDSIYNA